MTTCKKRKRVNFLWIVSTEALIFLFVMAAFSSAQMTTLRPPKVLIPPFTAKKANSFRNCGIESFRISMRN